MTPPIKRIHTGIMGLDTLSQGGFKEGSINLVAGGPGSGKTIFGIQFLIEGLRNGEPGIYVTFEERKDKLYEDMLGFGWDLEKYEKEGKFAFLEYTPEQVKNVLIEGGGTIDTLVSDMKATRMVIDSISSFALLYKDELSQKESALALFELINKWDCTAVLTSQEEEVDSSTINAALEFEVDSIILLYHSKKKGLRIRALEILKMRGTKHPEKTFSLEITPKGIKVLDKVCDI
ncbi:MAG: ATPase domain-containing protein [archaeon]